MLLGPVELDDVTDVRDEADFVIDADVGRPATRMGDVSGDGKTDLVFIRRDGAGGADAVITVIMGGAAGGLELPGYVNRDWINLVAAAEDQNRVRQLTIPGGGALVNDQLDLAVLNWDDDGLADLLLTYPDGWINGYIISGQALWRGEDADGNKDVRLRHRPGGGDLGRLLRSHGRGRGVPERRRSPTRSSSARTSARVVAGDVNGDGLEDVLFTDPDYVSFTDATLPHIGRAYLVTGRTGGGTHHAGRDAIPASASADQRPDHPGHLAGRRGGGPGRPERRRLRRLRGQPHAGRPRRRPDPRGRPAGLLRPARSWGDAARPIIRGDDADITVRRDDAAAIPEGLVYHGVLQATAGDFNADGVADLLVGEPHADAAPPSGSNTVLDIDERGTAYVLFSITERGRDAYLTDANSAIRGEFEFDHFGQLPAEPGIDLNGDRLDDILIGAPGADAVTTILIARRRQGVRGLRRLDAAGPAAGRPDRRPDQPDHHRQRRLPGGPRHRPGRDLPERLRRRRRSWTPPTSRWPPA